MEQKLCECGCGKPTSVALVTIKKKGHIKGKPQRFIQGHNAAGPGTTHVLSELDIDTRRAVCTVCGPVNVVYKNNKYYCNDGCRQEYAKNPSKHCEKNRENRLRVFFNLTPEDWDTMLAYQGGVCAITGKPAVNQRLSTDHNHRTGQIRGLLSIRANKGLAYFNDDPTMLRKAADYLENPPAVLALGKKVFGLIGYGRYKKTMVYGSENGPIKVAKKTRKKVVK